MSSGSPPTPPLDDSGWLTLNDAAQRLGVSAYTVRRWIREGRLSAEKRLGRFGEQYFVPEHAVTGGSAISDALPATALPPAGMPRRIVGRDRELASLRELLELAVAGSGRLALIGGEAGIGKSSLVEQTRHAAAERGARVLTGHCFDLETTPPHGPWLEIARELASEPGGAPPAFARATEDAAAFAGPQQLYREIEDGISQLAAQRPLLLVFEDMHWSDQASLDALRHVTRALPRLPLAIVVTYRDGELTPRHPLYRALPLLVREAQPLRITLRPLPRDAIDELLASRYPLRPEDRTRLRDWLHRYAQGNPLFIDELLGALEQQNVLRPGASGCELDDLVEFQVPPIIQQIIEGRLERLDHTARDLLQVAAVIGEEVPLDLWQAVAGADDLELAGAIEQALEAQILVELANRPALQFRHALIRQALYERMILLRRRGWHLRVAEALVTQPEPDPDSVAHHLQQAGDPRAADWLIRAGRRAARSHAYQFTIGRFERALELLRADPTRDAERAWLLCELAEACRYTEPRRALGYLDDAQPLVARLGDDALRAILLRSRSHIRGFLGEPALGELEEAVAVYERLSHADRERIAASALAYTVSEGTYAQRLAYYGRFRQARDLGRAFLARIGGDAAVDHHQASIALIGLAKSLAMLGEPAAAREAFASAYRHLDATGSAYMHALAASYEYWLVLHVYTPERVDERRRLIERVDHQYQESLYGALSESGATMRLFPALILAGRWQEARAAAEAMIATEAVRIDCATVLAILDARQGNARGAWAHVLAAIPAGADARPGTTYFLEVLELQRVAAFLALDAGDLDVARRWIDAHEHWVGWSEQTVGLAWPPLLRARERELAGDLPAALRHAEQARERAESPRQPLAIAACERMLGHLRMLAGDPRAAAHLHTALDIARACEAPYETALAQVALAELAARSGDDPAALLAPARDAALRLDARPLLARIDALAGEPAGPPTRLPGGLSQRELEVLRLVAQGHTDAEVADRLFISPRTVSGHLQSVYNKLGLSSRTAATAWAWEHDVV